MIKPLPCILAATACSLLLSSCYTFWNTGEKMKENAVTCTGLDMTRPVGDVVYQSGGKYYAELPEVKYHIKHTLWGVIVPSFEKFSDDPDRKYVDYIKPTGRTGWVEMKGCVRNRDGAFSTPYHGRRVAECPAGASPVPFAQETSWYTFPDEVLQTDSTRSERAWAYNMAAAPLTYVVDPVLTVGSTAILCAAATPFVAISAVGGIICAPSLIISQQQQPALLDAPAKQTMDK